jgi:hypothetical protein
MNIFLHFIGLKQNINNQNKKLYILQGQKTINNLLKKTINNCQKI